MTVLVCKVILYALAFFAGTCIFSFLNVVIYRVPRGQSFVKGFSACPSCKTRLKPLDLIPVISYLFLEGKCRYCKAKIGARDVLVEVLGGALAVLCAVHYGMQWEALLMYCFFGVLAVVTFLDIDTMEIPDGCEIAILLLAVGSVFVVSENGILDRVIGAVCVSVPMLLITLLIPGAFGGGDIKLMAACGLLLGWKVTVVSTILAILTGGFYGIFLLAAKKADRKAHFAFGPFLCVGMLIGALYGEQLWQWYLSCML